MNNNTNQENENIVQQNNDVVLEPIAPINAIESASTEESINTETAVPTQIENNTVDQQQVLINQKLQSIPTVDQDTQSFINNVQTMNEEKKEEKKEGVNFVFIIILFIIILVAIFFIFPILLDYV